VERAEEPVAAPVAGEHPARSVAPVRGGRQADQEDARVRIAEAGQRPRPVGFSAIAPGRIRGSGLAVAHEARAERHRAMRRPSACSFGFALLAAPTWSTITASW
jgi:hypothetical protein